MPTRKRYRCRYCGTHLNAYLPWAKAPNSALLLGHLGQQHLKEVGPYLQRMETESIDQVLSELFEVVEEEAI
jgi:dissimilatory sulfite reductase (desulfoviridin) alpha/beta subunit